MIRYLFNPLPTRAIILRCSLLGLVTFSNELAAQVSDSLAVQPDEWIEKTTDKVIYKLAVTNELEAFTVDAGNFKPEFFPNTSTTLKASFNYKFLSFTLKQAPSFIPGNDDDEMKGKTKNLGFSFGIINPHWFTSIGYAKHQGYYIRNSDEISNTWQSGDPYLQIPDMRVNSFEGMTGYSFNKNFSVRALTTQTERQLKSVGTFVPIAGYRLYFVNNLDDDGGQKSRNFEFILGAGYHYTFVMKKQFYASLGLTPGVGYIFTKLTTRGQVNSPGDITTKTEAPIVRADGRGALGYNGDKFFAGALIELRASSYEQQYTTVVNSDVYVFYQIFVGIKTLAPKLLKNAASKVPLKK